jgi:hypothetical protein
MSADRSDTERVSDVASAGKARAAGGGAVPVIEWLLVDCAAGRCRVDGCGRFTSFHRLLGPKGERLVHTEGVLDEGGRSCRKVSN